MGFYIDLELLPSDHYDTIEFQERHVPPVFWYLYLITGFALTCMGGAAYSVLGDLAEKGSVLDRGLVWLIAGALPIYAAIGFKLATLRKYIRMDGALLKTGYLWFGRFHLFNKIVERSSITAIELVNQKPTPNLAPRHHGNTQYYVRGHWRIVALLAEGRRTLTLDKHTEKGALANLYKYLQRWRSNSDVGTNDLSIRKTTVSAGVVKNEMTEPPLLV